MSHTKVLNLYCGIGGNRKLWEDVDVTAVEINKDIAKIYQDFYPQDTVVVGDAHSYLLKHLQEFDFIWASPPCPTHSRMNFLHNVKGLALRYPDMKLYQEIIILNSFFKGKYAVENVISYYKPLISPQESGGHYFWCNYYVSDFCNRLKVRNDKGCTLAVKMVAKNIEVKDFYDYDGDKRTILNNCIEPELGLHIFNESKKNVQTSMSFEQPELETA
jgi:DNA (cytosine-5)-methyltransferase 1